MSKLFAFNVSETEAHAPQVGQYDSAAQVWVGAEVAVAWPGPICYSSWSRCEQNRQKYANSGCTEDPFCILTSVNPRRYCFNSTCV